MKDSKMLCAKHRDICLVNASIGSCQKCKGYLFSSSFRLCNDCSVKHNQCAICETPVQISTVPEEEEESYEYSE